MTPCHSEIKCFGVNVVPGDDEGDFSQQKEDFRIRTARHRRRQTRARLVDSLFRAAEAGRLENISIDELRADAGLSRGAFYRYFPDLETMLAEVSGAIGAQINREMTELIGSDPNPARRIGRHIRYFVTRATTDRACAFLLLRTLPMSGAVSEYARERAHADFEEARAEGQFDLPSVDVAVELGHGIGLAMLRGAANARYDSEALSLAVTIMLRGFGVAASEARSLATEALPEIPSASLRQAAMAALQEKDTAGP